MPTLTPRDRRQLAQHGLPAAEAERQLALLRAPPPPVRLLRPCTLGDGIQRLDDQDAAALERAWRQAAAAGRLSKLVPASGAASRMFAALESVRAGSASTAGLRTLETLRARLADFGFHRHVEAAAGGPQALARADDGRLLELLLTPAGLDLAAQPKALIPFHRGPSLATGGCTPLEEHLLESRGYLQDAGGRCRVHFTVSARHKDALKDFLSADANGLFGDASTIYEVGFSTQAPSTDTIAIAADGSLFRTASGDLLLRPGGHGALLDNLGRLGGDAVVIKNIDNVVPAPAHAEVARVLGRLIGHAMLLEERLARARALVTEGGSSADEAIRLLAGILAAGQAQELKRLDLDAKRQLIRVRLDRPLRVCGVVRNTGEPGGGPFWVRGEDGQVSAQIVEGAEIDRGSGEQRATFARATHFNPVLLVCLLRGEGGKPHDLRRFTDPRRVFVAEKTAFGRPLRALEHPGLWNGAMAGWNTAFIEVPDIVFAPVKTVLDLLRPQHQVA